MFEPVHPIQWKRMPFVKLLMPFISGILVQNYSSYSLDFFEILPVIILFLLGISTIKRKENQLLFSGGIVIAVFLFGLYISYSGSPEYQNNHISKKRNETTNVYQGKIYQVIEKENSIELWIQLSQYADSSGRIIDVSGNIIVYTKDSIHSFQPDQYILFKGKIRAVNPPANPEAFDYAGYLEKKGVFGTSFLHAEAIRLTEPESTIRSQLVKVRKILIETLRNYIGDPDRFQVASAMILGYRNEMQDQLRDRYARTGLMHILAVSGLHIGIVYSLLYFLLGRIKSNGLLFRLFKTVLILAGIWIFVLIAGAPPSAVRAGFLFSVIQIGQLVQRDASIYNSLAAAAFCLLVWNPVWLTDIGFQLSFAAVWGIIYFHPKISGLIHVPGKAGYYFWSITSVSIAAQLTTTPISLFYFHQFPIYFWLSGIIGLPLAPVILLGGILLLFLHFVIPPFAGYIGSFLDLCLQILEGTTIWIAQFPGSGVGQGIWLDPTDLVLWYTAIGLFVLFLETRSKKWLLLILLVFAGRTVHQNWIHPQEEHLLTIYSMRSAQAIDIFTHGGYYTIFTGADPEQLEYAAEAWRIRNGKWGQQKRQFHSPDTTFYSSDIMIHKSCVHHSGVRLCFAQEKKQLLQVASFRTEILYIAGKEVYPSQLRTPIFVRWIVLDPNLWKSQVEAWKQYGKDRDIKVFNMYEVGAIWLSREEKHLQIHHRR